MNLKKLASLLLALVMLFTMIPTAAFAAEAFDGKVYFLTGPLDNLQARDVTTSGVGTMQGSTVNLRFNDSGDQPIAPANVEYGTLPVGIGFSGRNDSNSMLSFSIASDMTPGEYNVDFTVDGKTATVKFTVMGSSGGGGGSGSSVQLSYSPNGMSWMNYYGAGSPDIIIYPGQYFSFKLKVNGSDVPFELSDSTGSLTFQANGSIPSNEYRVSVADGAAEGLVQVTAAYSGGTMSPINVRILMPTVSDYTNAVVKEVTANSGSASFGAVTGELDTANSDAAFSIQSGELLFDTTGKTPGSYDAKVGGKLYTAVIFNATGGVAVGRAPVTVSTATITDESLLIPSQPFDGFYVWSAGQSHLWQNDSRSQFGVFENASNAFEPFYIYKLQGGSLVSMSATENVSLFGEEHFKCEQIELNGKKLFKLSPDLPTGGRVYSGGGSAVIDDNGAYIHSYSLIYSQMNSGTNWDKHGICGDEQIIDENQSRAVSINQISASTADGLVSPNTVYFVKQNGANVDYVLYDEINVSTLTATTDDASVANVTDFVVHTKGGKNAIGLTVDFVDTTQKCFCEVKVSFEDKAGNAYEWYIKVSSTPPVSTGETVVEVSNAAQFKVAFDNDRNKGMGAMLELAAGTYPMDIYIDNDHAKIGIRAAEGAEVIITGDPNSTNEAILTFDLGNMSSPIGGLTIDGNEHDAQNPRDGILFKNTAMAAAGDFTIRDCDVAIAGNENPGMGPQYVENNIIEKCRVGIEIFSASGSRVKGNTVKNCDIGILFKASANDATIKLNKLSGNTADFKTESPKTAYLTQNYFGHSVSGVEIGVSPVISDNTSVTETVFYSPYYTKSDFSTLGADIAGAEDIGGVLNVPVDLTFGAEATTFETDLFAAMKSASGDASVSIPVKEGDQNDSTVTTVWGFEKSTIDAAQEKETMDLRVTNELSAEAKAIVDEKVESGAVQYVNFAHDGDLPGTATVKVLKTNDTDAESLKLYYINEQTGEVEEADIISVTETSPDAAGNVYYIITVTHCSEYIISENLVIKTEQSGGGSGNEGSEGSGSTAPESGSAAATTPTSAKPASKPSSSANDFIGAEEVKDKLDAASGDEVAFDVSRKKLLTSKAFGLLADKPGKTMNLEGDGYSWSFDSDDITDEDAIKASNLDTSIGTESPNEKKISDALGGADHTTIHMAYNGRLPGKAEVSVDVGAENAGAKQLYLVNADGSFTHMGEVTVGEDGTVTFATDVAGDFVLLDEMLPEEPAAEPEPEAEPLPEQPAETQPAEPEKAGMPIWVPVAGIGALSLIAAIVVFIINKRRGI